MFNAHHRADRTREEPPIQAAAQAAARRRAARLAAWRLAIAVACLLVPVSARAQLVFESVGERALGMAGAFVAVADDATAVHWNPAGLAASGPAGMTIGWYRFQFGDRDGPAAPGAVRRGGTFTSLGTWPLGISYGSFDTTSLVEGDGGEVRADTLHVSQFGVTVLQSVVPGLVVGSTLKFLRADAAGIAAAPMMTAGDALALGEDQRGDRHNAFDLDLGVMASSDLLRVGLTVKNLRSPSFGEIPGSGRALPRQVRLGVAVLPADGVTLAMDLDLDTVDLAGGLRRMGAVGGEVALGSRLSVRSGVRWSLVGPRHPVGAVGASVALRPSLWLDGHYAKGQLHDDVEFGAALRAGF